MVGVRIRQFAIRYCDIFNHTLLKINKSLQPHNHVSKAESDSIDRFEFDINITAFLLHVFF